LHSKRKVQRIAKPLAKGGQRPQARDERGGSMGGKPGGRGVGGGASKPEWGGELAWNSRKKDRRLVGFDSPG